jgi:hypothetical protein
MDTISKKEFLWNKLKKVPKVYNERYKSMHKTIKK